MIQEILPLFYCLPAAWSLYMGYVAQVHVYNTRRRMYLCHTQAELDRLVEIVKGQNTKVFNGMEGIHTAILKNTLVVSSRAQDYFSARNSQFMGNFSLFEG